MTRIGVAGVMLLLGCLAGPARAEDAPAAAPAKRACCQAAAAAEGEKPPCCQAAAAAAAGALDAKVAAMNAAEGPAKIDAIAAVLTELVAQHKAMPHTAGGCMHDRQGHDAP